MLNHYTTANESLLMIKLYSTQPLSKRLSTSRLNSTSRLFHRGKRQHLTLCGACEVMLVTTAVAVYTLRTTYTHVMARHEVRKAYMYICSAQNTSGRIVVAGLSTISVCSCCMHSLVNTCVYIYALHTFWQAIGCLYCGLQH